MVFPSIIPPLVPQTISPAIVPSYWKRFHFLSFLVQRNDWRAGAEIGLAAGQTSRYLLAHNPDLHMIGVDSRMAFPGHAGPDDFEQWDHAWLNDATMQALAPYADRFVMFTKLSVDAAEGVPDASLDFVFIDADHSEAACRADIIAWLPKIRADGWITGHDISWPSVARAVDDMIPGYQIGPDVVWFRPVHPWSNWWRGLHHG
jgi:predicted O-methyltransferase YrrM